MSTGRHIVMPSFRRRLGPIPAPPEGRSSRWSEAIRPEGIDEEEKEVNNDTAADWLLTIEPTGPTGQTHVEDDEPPD